MERGIELLLYGRSRPIGHARPERAGPLSATEIMRGSSWRCWSAAACAPSLDAVDGRGLEQQLAGDRRRPVDQDRPLQREPLIVARLGRREEAGAERAEAVALDVVEEADLVLGVRLPREAGAVVHPRSRSSSPAGSCRARRPTRSACWRSGCRTGRGRTRWRRGSGPRGRTTACPARAGRRTPGLKSQFLMMSPGVDERRAPCTRDRCSCCPAWSRWRSCRTPCPNTCCRLPWR